MKSKLMQRVLRLLITLLGAGVGLAVAMGAVQLIDTTQPDVGIPLGMLVTGYSGMALLGALVFFLLSGRILGTFSEMGAKFERRLDEMSMGQLTSCTLGVIFGLIIAALITLILRFMGNSMFTTILAIIFYLVFGVMGFTIGKHRAGEMDAMLKRVSAPQLRSFVRKRKARKKATAPVSAKLLDTSALIDGRIVEVCRTGFVEGELVVSEFVLTELRHIADSTDAQRRMKGRRGLDMLVKLQENRRVTISTADFADTTEVDVKLLRLAKTMNAAVITGDYNLCRAAHASGVKALNVNELAGALRPAVLPGEEMRVTITKDGKEPGQGVAYLPDGTMVVVENGRAKMGEDVIAVVSTALQTSAGRMIFARLKDE